MMNRGILNPMTFRTHSPSPIEPGIYWNEELGLISIGRLIGQTPIWKTIADKNVGASAVYNHGDTLSETKCGKGFQRGNCYGFHIWGENEEEAYYRPAMVNYGTYYEWNVFCTGLSRDSSNNLNLWGYLDTEIESSRGPCPDGFYVPGPLDWDYLVSSMGNIGIDTSNGEFLKTYFKMPFAGARLTTGEIDREEPLYGAYWTSNPEYWTDGDEVHNFYRICISFDSTIINVGRSVNSTLGLSIRPFKCVPVAPDESWTVLYDGGNGKGVFWNPAQQIISYSPDGHSWYTMADRNLGATHVYNIGDELTENNCGGYFQRGNNYMFPFSGEIETSSNQANAENFGPFCYREYKYTGDSASRESSGNPNLWGYVPPVLSIIGRKRRGPCPEGFNIPTKSDLDNLDYILSGLLDGHTDTKLEAYEKYLKMPRIDNNQGKYRTAEVKSRTSDVEHSYYLGFTNSSSSISTTENKDICYIRPFKNEAVIPDGSWTKLL